MKCIELSKTLMEFYRSGDLFYDYGDVNWTLVFEEIKEVCFDVHDAPYDALVDSIINDVLATTGNPPGLKKILLEASRLGA